MLTTTSRELESDDSINDVSQGLVDSIRALIKCATLLQEESRKDPTKCRFYRMPTLNKSKAIENLESGDLNVDFTFNKFGKLFTFNIQLPIFANLAPKVLQAEPVDPMSDYYILQNYINRVNYELEFYKFIYRPFMKVILGAVALANFISTIAPRFSKSIVPTVMHSASLPVKLLGVFVSTIYFIPIIAYYLGDKFLRSKLDAFYSEVNADIKAKRGQAAYTKMKNFPLLFHFLLLPVYPNNRDLLQKYYIMLGYCDEVYGPNGSDNYKSSLRYTDNQHDKLLPLKKIINAYEQSLQNTLEKIPLRSKDGTEYAQRCEKARVNSAQYRAPYVAQIPIDAPLYHELGAEVRAQIQECIAMLREQQFYKATQHFYTIKWDAYSTHAYPDAAIMYYQIEAVITFFSKKKTRPDVRDIEHDQCINFGMNSVSKIQSIIDKYYPEKSQEYKDIMLAYDKVRHEIFEADEPKREYSVTVLPDIYTPLALAEKQRQDALRSEQERLQGEQDVAPNVEPSRSPSPGL